MSIVIIRSDKTTTKTNIKYTSRALEFWERESIKYGEIVSVELKNGNKLILTSEFGDIIEFDGPFTGGYIGGGSRGTQEILALIGFQISDEFIVTNTSFKLTK